MDVLSGLLCCDCCVKEEQDKRKKTSEAAVRRGLVSSQSRSEIESPMYCFGWTLFSVASNLSPLILVDAGFLLSSGKARVPMSFLQAKTPVYVLINSS